MNRAFYCRTLFCIKFVVNLTYILVFRVMILYQNRPCFPRPDNLESPLAAILVVVLHNTKKNENYILEHFSIKWYVPDMRPQLRECDRLFLNSLCFGEFTKQITFSIVGLTVTVSDLIKIIL